MLESPKAKALALFALSRGFDGSITTAGDYRLIPDADGKLVKHSIHKLPPDADIRKAWEVFWKVKQGKYTWDAKRHPLRERR